MKVLGLILLLAFTCSSTFLAPLGLGESCDKSPTLNINNVVVTPFPVIGTQQYTVTLSGVFAEKEYIEQVYIGQRLNKGFWHYNYQSVKQEFAKGANYTFTVSLQGPSVKGSYTDQFTFHRSDFSYVACWQYDFDIK